MKIQEKTVLITGACSGIGKIMARRCLEKGAAQVIIWDINEAAIAATVEELSALGKVFGRVADISSPESVEAAYEATRAACGPVDLLINNAGIITNNKTFAEQTVKDIDRTIDINTKGAMYVALLYLKEMKERGVGHICNITSSAGMLALPKMSLYAASKWAAIGWSESVRIELEREKSPVKVTTIAPKALRAVELNLGYRGINFPSHFIRLMQGIFPYRWFNFVFGDICGLYTVMNHFTGRKK